MQETTWTVLYRYFKQRFVLYNISQTKPYWSQWLSGHVKQGGGSPDEARLEQPYTHSPPN